MRAIADFLAPDFTIIGHRGAAGLVPENTLPGFQRALELGCPMIELDVHRVADAEAQLLVLHDAELDRTTSGSGEIADHTLAELRRLDAGGGERIPLLEEVAELLIEHRSRAGLETVLNVELKGSNTAEPTAAFAARHPELPLLVSSFQHSELIAYRRLRPADWVAPLYARYDANWQATAERLSACAVNLSWRIATPSRVRAIRSAGYAVFVYTVNQLSTARRLKAMGVSGVFTDRPDRLLADGRWRGG